MVNGRNGKIWSWEYKIGIWDKVEKWGVRRRMVRTFAAAAYPSDSS